MDAMGAWGLMHGLLPQVAATFCRMMHRLTVPGRLVGILVATLAATGGTQELQVDRELVPTRQWIRPAGDSLAYPGRPVDLAVTSDQATVIVKDNLGLAFLDLPNWELRQRLKFPEGGGSMHGLAVSPDGLTAWATTAQDQLYEAVRQPAGLWRWRRSISLPGPDGEGDSHAGGMALDADNQRLYVCLSRNNELGIVDLLPGRLVERIPVGVAPYDVVLLPGGQQAIVSNWGGRHPRPDEASSLSSGTLVLVDERGVARSGTVGLVDLVAGRQVLEQATGLHPADLIWDPAGQLVMVANANSDTVSILDPTTLTVRHTVFVRPIRACHMEVRATRWL